MSDPPRDGRRTIAPLPPTPRGHSYVVLINKTRLTSVPVEGVESEPFLPAVFLSAAQSPAGFRLAWCGVWAGASTSDARLSGSFRRFGRDICATPLRGGRTFRLSGCAISGKVRWALKGYGRAHRISASVLLRRYRWRMSCKVFLWWGG